MMSISGDIGDDGDGARRHEGYSVIMAVHGVVNTGGTKPADQWRWRQRRWSPVLVCLAPERFWKFRLIWFGSAQVLHGSATRRFGSYWLFQLGQLSQQELTRSTQSTRSTQLNGSMFRHAKTRNIVERTLASLILEATSRSRN
ncbi:hypothetical protein Hdeb2414_s0013g00417341 [Helianthus debilis subsp. tardiflorus]